MRTLHENCFERITTVTNQELHGLQIVPVARAMLQHGMEHRLHCVCAQVYWSRFQPESGSLALIVSFSCPVVQFDKRVEKRGFLEKNVDIARQENGLVQRRCEGVFPQASLSRGIMDMIDQYHCSF